MAVPMRILVLGLLMIYVASVQSLSSDRTRASGKLKQSVLLRRLVKRFNPDMFACGTCTAQMECRTDVDCEHIHTHGYKCRLTCCGLLCIGHDTQHLFQHLMHQDSLRQQVPCSCWQVFAAAYNNTRQQICMVSKAACVTLLR